MHRTVRVHWIDDDSSGHSMHWAPMVGWDMGTHAAVKARIPWKQTSSARRGREEEMEEDSKVYKRRDIKRNSETDIERALL